MPILLFDYAVAFLALYFTFVLFLILLTKFREENRKKPKTNFEPTVSFIIPAYNEEKSIARAIRSIQMANYPKAKIQIIVVDDGSTDSTAAVARSLGAEVIQKAHTNKADSLNWGIARARGEIIITLDADSWITRNSIRILLSHFENDVAAVTATIKTNKRKKMSLTEKLQEVEYVVTSFNRKIFSLINCVYATPGPMSAFRREIFDEIGGFQQGNIMEDQEMAFRIQQANYRIVSCTDAIVYTEVPRNFSAFFKQRLRWHRGGIRNIFAYSHLASPKYGDFGVFMMPLSIISFVFVFFILFNFTQALTNPMPIAITPLHIITFLLIAMTIVWTHIAIDKMGMRFAIIYLPIYVIVYAYLISFFTIAAIACEILRVRDRW